MLDARQAADAVPARHVVHSPNAQQLHVAGIPVAALHCLGAGVDHGLALCLRHHQVDQLAAVGRLQPINALGGAAGGGGSLDSDSAGGGGCGGRAGDGV